MQFKFFHDILELKLKKVTESEWKDPLVSNPASCSTWAQITSSIALATALSSSLPNLQEQTFHKVSRHHFPGFQPSSENLSLVSNLDFPSYGLQPLSLVTLSGTTKNSLISGCWKYSTTFHPHFRQIVLSCLLSQLHKLSNMAILAAFWPLPVFLHPFWPGGSKL